MKNIVLLDDDLMSLRSLEHTLNEWGYNTVSFLEYNKAFREYDFNQANCIIIDYHLQGDNGITILHKLKKAFPKLRKLLISGYNINDMTLKLNKSNFDYYLPKPIDITSLNEILKKTNKEKK
ncbi:MAG: response regulator [Candidatus Cloacimonadales bacterium]|jgi:DNA-binding NtrC family response regulator|nr:response regulator [Candidatus Cloacimonadota bacterium]MDX9978155.1 response regulator [Candidatus Cloacimonadales bacterium]